ncbi:MAG: PBP1A family penicillin-binding protein [Gemmatimonas sp.]|nr:PBP1A family penicillin-binding protein [Gemmatimonas sp.]
MSRRRRVARPSGRVTRPAGWSRPSRAVFALFGLMLVAFIAGAVWLWPRCSGEGCPSVQALRDYSPPQATRVYDSRAELIAHLAPERRIVVPLERIPAHVAGAFLAVEDRRFFSHDGVDYRRVVGAALHDLRTRSFEQGFSTITMQLARNVFPEHLTRAKTLRRKTWEIMLARQMEREFGKDEILEMYLNQIYLGDGLYGVEAAAQGYFGKRAVELEIAEAAMLAALPKAPSRYNPRTNPIDAVRRRNLVLSLMADARVISDAEAEVALAEPLDLAAPIEASGDAPYFIAAIRRELHERFGDGAETAGLRVFTGLDREMQTFAAEALRAQIAAVEGGELGRFRGPNCSTGKIEDTTGCLQGVFVALDNLTGDVLALVGGRDFAVSQFNRATQAQRQAGSAFKPFIFATALTAGIPITTPLLGPGAADYEGGYHPADHVSADVPVDMREAMRLSSNRAAVALGERIGVASVVRTAQSMGITTPLHEYPSTLLGASEVVPIELVTAFTTFANNGRLVTPRFIQRVEDANGRLLWESSIHRQPVLSPEVAFLTTSMMRDVVDRGTGTRVRSAGLSWEVPAAGKTGTTNDSADAWFVGFTPDVTAGVWVGFDKRQEIISGGGGGSIAAPVWGEVMASYYRDRPTPIPWLAPIDLVSAEVDRESGHLATSHCPGEHVVTEWFIPGTEPRTYCPLHPQPRIETWVRRGLRELGELIGVRP